MKFLKAVRLDDSDARIYAEECGAAEDGEWVVSGGYAVCDLAMGHRRSPCHCNTSFIAVESHGRCTIAEVADIDSGTYAHLADQLAQYFLNDLGAPTPESAREAADDECAHSAEIAAGFPAEGWITVTREPTIEGVGERYSLFKRLMIGAHKL
jgi:hypothetical protein